jgi:hypothetical protein
VVIVLILSQFLINLTGVRIASRINNVAAFTAELAASIVLTLILLVVGLFINRENSLGFLTSSEGVPTGGFLSAFLLSGLLGHLGPDRVRGRGRPGRGDEDGPPAGPPLGGRLAAHLDRRRVPDDRPG